MHQLERDKLNSSNTFVSHRLTSNDLKRLTLSTSGQLLDTFLNDESLHDEDAWRPILDIVNAEVNIRNSYIRKIKNIYFILARSTKSFRKWTKS